jgi:hypothetical protein
VRIYAWLHRLPDQSTALWWGLAFLLALLTGLPAQAKQQASLTLLSPAGGETWSAGSLHLVTWKGERLPPGATVEVDWSADGGKTFVGAGKAPATVSRFLWKVPEKVSRDAVIRLRVASGPTARNAAPFAITPSREVKGYRWVNVTHKAAFAPRDGAGALVFKGKMWLLGGWNPRDKKHFPRICNNEVWSSSTGEKWVLEKPNTFLDRTFDSTRDWEGRHTAGYVVFKDRMWIVGGDVNQGHYHDDVWNSADGKTWSLVNKGKKVPWGPRALHCTVAFKDRIMVMGGQTIPQIATEKEVFYRDVWTSTDGISWEKLALKEPCWSARGMIGGSVVFNNRVWVLGGGTYDTPKIPKRKFHNDVWSSADGISWTRHLEEAPWAPRQYHEVAVFDGRMWVMEGYREGKGNRNDVWYSADGVNWYEVPKTPWAPRHAASVFVHDDALWMVAGNNMQSDVWKLVRPKAGR